MEIRHIPPRIHVFLSLWLLLENKLLTRDNVARIESIEDLTFLFCYETKSVYLLFLWGYKCGFILLMLMRLGSVTRFDIWVHCKILAEQENICCQNYICFAICDVVELVETEEIVYAFRMGWEGVVCCQYGDPWLGADLPHPPPAAVQIIPQGTRRAQQDSKRVPRCLVAD